MLTQKKQQICGCAVQTQRLGGVPAVLEIMEMFDEVD
jgi:hypothetical protein